MKILNPQEWPKNSQDLLFFGDDELENLLEYYEHPNIHDNVQCSPLFDVNKYYNDTFPNIIKLIQLVYCIPFSSVECERGFSRQNQIKTKSRNSLTTDTLDRLMRISLEGPKSSKFNYNRAYTIWSNQKRRIGVEK
ncbi:unnamed protein product [Rhizophagus irregularis]|nr:unnamed protein product [Rhizophagus irregularis]